MSSNMIKYSSAFLISLLVHGIIMHSIALPKKRQESAAKTVYLQLAAIPMPAVPLPQEILPKKSVKKAESEPIQTTTEQQTPQKPIIETPVLSSVESFIEWEPDKTTTLEKSITEKTFVPEPMLESTDEPVKTDKSEIESYELAKPDNVELTEEIPSQLEQDPVDEPKVSEISEFIPYEIAELKEPEITEESPLQTQQLAIYELAKEEIGFSSSEDAVISYRKTVLLMLEQCKRYPKRARRLGFEGEVTVRFSVASDGNINNMKLSKKCPYRALNKAAERLVRKVSPLPTPPAGISQLEFTLRYDLDH